MVLSVEQLCLRAGKMRNPVAIPNTRRNSLFSIYPEQMWVSRRLLFNDNLVFFPLKRPKLDRTSPSYVDVKIESSLFPILP